MNQFGVDYHPEMDDLPEIDTMEEAGEFPGFNGEMLIDKVNKVPFLGEVQVCKVISHLLEALMFLNDRRMTHQDMSHRNYLVDENLNVSARTPLSTVPLYQPRQRLANEAEHRPN